jgi:formimidoylglutamate deiminase
VGVGVAPHSVRAVPLEYLRSVISQANEHGVENSHARRRTTGGSFRCVEEYRRTPTALLESEGLLGRDFTAVHAIHVTPNSHRRFC